jgi:hypothetical protein
MARYYLIRDRSPHGVEYLVFTVEDPRLDGYQGELEEGVSIDSNGEDVFTPQLGEEPPEVCVGRDPQDWGRYRVFRSPASRDDACYEPVTGLPVVLHSWRRHLCNTGRA